MIAAKKEQKRRSNARVRRTEQLFRKFPVQESGDRGHQDVIAESLFRKQSQMREKHPAKGWEFYVSYAVDNMPRSFLKELLLQMGQKYDEHMMVHWHHQCPINYDGKVHDDTDQRWDWYINYDRRKKEMGRLSPNARPKTPR